MSELSFYDMIEEDVGFNLTFPYHIHFEKLNDLRRYNTQYPDSYHCHNFDDVLYKAYLEPKAFYLTEEDKKYYSSQEIELINRVLKCYAKKLDNNRKETEN